MEKEIIGIGAHRSGSESNFQSFASVHRLLFAPQQSASQTTYRLCVGAVGAGRSRFQCMRNNAKECGKDIRPIRVQRRMCPADLHVKFFVNNSMATGPPNSQKVSHEIVLLHDDDDMKGEVMELLTSPEHISESKLSNGLKQQRDQKMLTKQKSLLKPKAERISTNVDDQKRKSSSPPPSHEAIKLSPFESPKFKLL